MRNKWLLMLIVVSVLCVTGCAKKADAQPVDENAIVVDASEVQPTEEVTVADELSALDLSDIVGELPAFKQGIFYNPVDSEVDYIMTLEIAKWKDVSFEAGYSPTITALGVVSYPIVKLKNLGVTLPVLDLVELNVGVGAGLKRIQLVETDGGNEFVWGATATLINIKW